MGDKNCSVLFLELNSSYSHSMLSYCMLRALAEKNAAEWSWHHVETTLKTPVNETLKKVYTIEPTLIIATAYIFNIDLLCLLAAEIKKKLTECMIFFGGPNFIGSNHQFLLDNPQIDGVLRGDETSVPELLNAVKADFDWKNVSGLCRVEQGRYFDNGIAEFKGELDELPSPYVTPYLHDNKPFYQLETSRGCLGSCTFCTSAVHKAVKTFSIDRIKTDLEALRSRGFREIRLIDRTFNETAGRAVAMLKLFRDNFPEMKFHLEIHPARLQSEVKELLCSMPEGQLHIEAGIQSFDPVVLKNIKRSSADGIPERGLKELVEMQNFEVHADLISGLPGQTLASLEQDINRMLQIGPAEIQLEPLKILPGTPILNQLKQWDINYMVDPPWQVLSSATMSKDDIDQSCLYSHVLDSYYNHQALCNVFSYCSKNMSDFFTRFSSCFKKYRSSSGKLPLERRFDILEDYLESRSALKSLQLCRFGKLAAGFKVNGLNLSKRPAGKGGKCIWSNGNTQKAVRVCQMKCNFNAADYWLDRKCNNLKTGDFTYIFLMHYGRNVCKILQKNT
ncbi:radical SAM protein [Lentisphaerota bacterium ZTH]|nr:B12-binding domain-containing radical SAM protein [Lentisphaerota bacterium]WET07683.1 radical SAM protein [Lentisphaerota bacterium ZTH]